MLIKMKKTGQKIRCVIYKQVLFCFLFPRAMSQADAKQIFGECRKSQIPRPLRRFKFHVPLLAAGSLTLYPFDHEEEYIE